MTPEAVIFRYLEILRGKPVDRDLAHRILCVDADLLGRWLMTFACPAEPRALYAALEGVDEQSLHVLAQAHAWTMLPSLDTARLAMDQWQMVCVGAHLAQAVAAQLLAAGWRNPAVQDPLQVRMQVLLAISGVNLPHDDALTEISEFRGTEPSLLMDAGPVAQIFAIVEALDTQGTEQAADLAEQFFEFPEGLFATLLAKAQAACSRELTELALSSDDNVDWGDRLWVQQHVGLLCELLPQSGSPSSDGFRLAHEQICRSLFGHVPELLLPDSGDRWQTLLHPGVRVRRQSAVSAVALSGRDGASRMLVDRAEIPVADRQILRHLNTEEGLVLPVPSGHAENIDVVAVLVFAADDELEPDVAMRAYATAVGAWLEQSAINAPGDQVDALTNFRDGEMRRLRELVHEANNPLSIVQNYLHILELRVGDEPGAKEQLDMIGRELSRTIEIIQRMKDVPKPDEGQQPEPIALASFDLNAVVRQVATLHEGAAQEKDIEIDRWLSLGRLEINSDPDAVTQVLTNLLKNAVEACQAGDTISLTTHASVVRDGELGVEVTVQDSGPGLPLAVLQSIWDAKNSSKGGDHEGLGLHLVYRLVSALRGHIDVRTSSETGTSFGLFLPLDVSATQPTG